MSKLLQCKIDVTKIDKSLLFKGKKGTYLDINIWLNDKPDKYENDCSIEQRTPKDRKDKIYIGNGRYYQPQAVKIDSNDDTPDEVNDMPF